MKLSELPLELQRIFLLHIRAFTIACDVLEEITKKPGYMWAGEFSQIAGEQTKEISDEDIKLIIKSVEEDVSVNLTPSPKTNDN